jgi:undecaprenyl-diphosphatase
LSDKYSQKTLTVKDMNGKQALFIGMAQTLALIPGVSRSGATLTAALDRNFKRESAARFSLLLSMPAILGAAILEIKNLGTLLSGNLLLAIGIAALSSYLAIKLLMNYISKIGYKGFAIYRIILALAIIITYFIRLS